MNGPNHPGQMGEQERELRYGFAVEHFVAYGLRIEDDDARLRGFLNDTAAIPMRLYRAALRSSRQASDSGFPPSCGQVIHAARVISLHGQDKTYYPRWFRRLVAGKIPEYEGTNALLEGGTEE